MILPSCRLGIVRFVSAMCVVAVLLGATSLITVAQAHTFNFFGKSAKDLKQTSTSVKVDLPLSKCQPTGCSGEICADTTVDSICIYRAEYACYKKAVCERQASGQCGWSYTGEAAACFTENGCTVEPIATCLDCTHPLVVSCGGTGQKTAQSVKWGTDHALFAADALTIQVVNRVFHGAAPYTIHSDTPDTFAGGMTTLEVTWNENTVEMRLFLYFRIAEDDPNVWELYDIRSYNGLNPGSWVYYTARAGGRDVMLRGKIGSTPLTGDFTFVEKGSVGINTGTGNTSSLIAPPTITCKNCAINAFTSLSVPSTSPSSSPTASPSASPTSTPPSGSCVARPLCVYNFPPETRCTMEPPASSYCANADITGDGLVDLDDYTILRASISPGTIVTTTTQRSDLSLDGYVDLDDYSILVQSFDL